MNRQEIGSRTAKGGFENEKDVCQKFLNFKNDEDARVWLTTMGYNFIDLILKDINTGGNF